MVSLKRAAVRAALAAAVLFPATAGVHAQSVNRGQYNLTPPTLADGALGNIQLDANGNTKVSIAGGSGGTVTANQGTAGAQAWPVTQSPSSAAGQGVAYVSSTALAANQVIKASAGNLYSFEVSADSTLSAAAWWIMIYDATSAPGDGAVTPAKCYAMPSGTTGYAAAFFTPLRLATGITIGVSTTGCFSKTASTHAFISGDAQ